MRKENDKNDNDDIYKNEELVFNCIKSVKVNGIVELLQYLNNIPIEHLTSPSFLNKLEHALKDDSTGRTIPLSNIILYNYPSNSLIFLEYLKDKGLHLKQLICSPQIYISVLNSSFNLYGKIKDQIILKNKIEERAQSELVKTLFDLSFEIGGFDIKGNGKKMMNDALESRNLKIIKYFVSLSHIDIKNISHSFKGRNALHIALLPIWNQGVDIHLRDHDGETILHLAAKYHSLKIIKYLVSLGIDIHSLDNQKNTVLLSAFCRKFYIMDLEYYKFLERVVKYFISIGVNVDHQNEEDGMDALLGSIECTNFELINFIGSSMSSLSLKSPDRYNINSQSFQNAIHRLIKSFNIETIKYLDEIPCFANYFDGRNKIKSKNSILFYLISYYISREIKFGKFKEVFQFFLNKRNNINSINVFNQVAIQQDYKHFPKNCWKYWDYLIEKGINLNNISTKGLIQGSILNYLLNDRENNHQEYGKYIMIRSMEINSQIVNHPKFDDLKDEDSFEDFFRKDEEEENEEKVIKWKRGMAEILMKSPNILNLFSPKTSYVGSSKWTFDEKSSRLIKINI